MKSKARSLTILSLALLGALFLVAKPHAQGDPISCLAILRSGGSTGDGVYTIDPDGPGGQAPVQVYCDMTTDGGGWTLVGSTQDTTFNDQASTYYADLATQSPADGHEGIWDGMRPVAWHPLTDIRFSCRDEAYTGAFDVDLAFYDIPWYEEITASPGDANVCFEDNNGAGQTLPPPARQNLLTGETRPLGDQWDAGVLEGEDICYDLADFTVDFDNRGMDGNQADGTDWGEDDGALKCGRNGIAGGTWFVWVREPVGVFLSPPSATGFGVPDSTVVYTETLLNLTGATDSFTLTPSGNAWPTTLSIPNTGPISNGDSVDFTVQVDVPSAPMPGESDVATVQATSVTSPTVYSDTAIITTTAICTPNLTFTGQSARATWLGNTYDYGGQLFTWVYLYAYTTSGGSSIEATVSGFNGGTGTWETIGQWSYAPRRLLVDRWYVPPVYSQIRVEMRDTSGNQVYYDYQFMFCREPAVDLNPPSQGSLVHAGTTAIYTQTVTNYTMATDSFDLLASGNSWPATFWDGPTQISNSGPLADLGTFTFTVKVEVPAGASGGDSDQTTIRARSVASPAVSDAGSLRTVVLAYPWVQAFSEEWAPDASVDWEQYLGIVRSSGTVAAQVTDDWDGQYTPPAVAAYPRQAIVAAWTGPSHWNGTVYYYNIEYAALDTDGHTVISVTQVSNNISTTIYTFDSYPAPAVAPTDGNVLIAWYRYETVPDSLYNVYYAVRSPAGTEVLPPTALTTNTTSTVQDYYDVSAAAFGDGRFAIGWQHYENGVYDIYYAVLDSAGGLIVGPVNLTHNTGYDDYNPRANRLADGNVLLTWYGYHGFGYEIYYAVLDSAGNVVHPVTRLTDMTYDAYYPDAVGLRSGNTVVAWQQDGYYPNRGLQMAYAVLDSTYTATVATQILTNTLSNDNWCVSLARDGDDNAVLTWRDSNMDRIYYAVVDHSGGVRTEPMVFRTARGSRLDISWWGAASGSLPPARTYLPLVVRNYTPRR